MMKNDPADSPFCQAFQVGKCPRTKVAPGKRCPDDGRHITKEAYDNERKKYKEVCAADLAVRQ